MEISLQATERNYYRRLEAVNTVSEASADIVVPDVCPDIEEILVASGIFLLHSKSIESDCIRINGSVSAQILYSAEDGSAPHKLDAELPFQFTADHVSGEDALSTVSVSIACMEAEALNPRKLRVRCSLCIRICLFEAEKLTVCSELPEAYASALCVKRELRSADIITGVYEKSFIVTDTFPFTGAESGIREILGKSITLHAKDCRYLGSKMILRGDILTELIWRSEEGEIRFSSFRSEFSQILELDTPEPATVDTAFLLNGAYFELFDSSSDSKTFTSELHITAQAVCMERAELSFVSDAYSNSYVIQPVYVDSDALFLESREQLRDSMRGLIEAPYIVKSVLLTLADAGLCTVSEDVCSCPVNMRLLLRDEEDRLHGVTRSFTARWTLPQEAGETDSVRSVSCEELHAAPAAGGVEIRMLAEAEYRLRVPVRLHYLQAVEADETETLDLRGFPSITVLPQKSDDLWSLAKQYHSTVELIEETNRDLDTSVILIPRAR